ETIEKFEEDVYGFARPKGRRRARVLFGEPIDLKQAAAAGRARTVAHDVTARLEAAIQGLMAQRPAGEAPGLPPRGRRRGETRGAPPPLKPAYSHPRHLPQHPPPPAPRA